MAKTNDLVIRNGSLEDIDGVYRIVKTSTLDDNSRYFYLMMLSYFSHDSAVVIDPALSDSGRSDIIGFIVGLSSTSQKEAQQGHPAGDEIPRLGPEDYFCWQVGVDNEYRGLGIAKRLLDYVTKPYENLQATVTPSNNASMSLFQSYAKRHKKKFAKRVLFEKEHFGKMDHEEEFLIDIK
jgi:L-2,4-diaminobutyric acid acetyltransferase